MELTQLTGYSKEYLSSEFKNVTGLPISKYIIECRLNAAKRFLLNTKKSASEIAHLTEFESPNYFSRIFKKEVGIKPIKHRKYSNI